MFAVFDIGGTHIRAAVSRDGKKLFGEPTRLRTPQSFAEASKRISTIIKNAGTIERVCVAIAGEFDDTREKLVFSPNLPGWVEKPLKKMFAEASGAPVTLINDAVAAAIAEARLGAGKGRSVVAYITVGTGLGGAKVVDGKLDKNHSGFEPGQQIVDVHTGATLESFVSGSGFSKRYGPDFVHTAPLGAWQQAAHDLAVGIHNTIDYWSPDIIVLGGSMILRPTCIPLESIRRRLMELKPHLGTVPVVKAVLGDVSGLCGALSVLSDPA